MMNGTQICIFVAFVLPVEMHARMRIFLLENENENDMDFAPKKPWLPSTQHKYKTRSQ